VYQVQRSAVSALHVVASVYVPQGSTTGVGPGVGGHAHGAQAVFAGQTGQLQAVPASALPVPELVFEPVPAPPSPEDAPRVGTVLGPVEPLPVTPTAPWPHAQSHDPPPVVLTGQAHVQVPPPELPLPPPLPVPHADPPPEPFEPPQSQAQGGQAAPGAQAGQAQVQVPPPTLPDPVPPSVAGGGAEQSHCTAGQLAFAGQARG
jgi:hypothetical protein